MADHDYRRCHCDQWGRCLMHCPTCGCGPYLTPSADVPACRDEDPAHATTRAACYPDPPEYQHPDGDPQ